MIRVTRNPDRRARETDLDAAADRWLPPSRIEAALSAVRAWPGYAAASPRVLSGLSGVAGVGAILYQDEGGRFGLGSFKGWGGGYATTTMVHRARSRGERSITVACATDGNHGLAVARAAREAGAAAVVYVADIVTPYRAGLIEAEGARVVRSDGDHEVASAECLEAAREHGWYVITETENATEPEIASDILSGYGALWNEVFDSVEEAPTHLFVQAGVGGLAATASAISRRRYGDARPVMAVVEARGADCIRRSIERGERVAIEGPFDTSLAGLAAGATSTFAWELLRLGADFAAVIRDEAAEEAVRRLADSVGGDPIIEAGASGAAGLGAALAACANAELRQRMGIDATSRLLVIGTEGPTDPEGFSRIVGRRPRSRPSAAGSSGHP